MSKTSTTVAADRKAAFNLDNFHRNYVLTYNPEFGELVDPILDAIQKDIDVDDAEKADCDAVEFGTCAVLVFNHDYARKLVDGLNSTADPESGRLPTPLYVLREKIMTEFYNPSYKQHKKVA